MEFEDVIGYEIYKNFQNSNGIYQVNFSVELKYRCWNMNL